MKSIFVLIVVLFLFLLLCCENSKQCTENPEITVNINFKTISDDGMKDTLIDKLTVIGKDTPYYNNNSIKSINLSLSQSSDTSKFKFVIDTVVDTIIFYSKREHFLVSYECGFATRFILDKIITQNKLLDSLSIIKATVTSSDETNIIFYF
jgi:hypothetical protein